MISGNLLYGLGGAAKAASARLKDIETDLKERIKTQSATTAKEMSAITRTRTENATQYKSKARMLQSRYGLNDLQVEAVLAGGLDNADNFIDTVRQSAIQAQRDGVTFDPKAAASNLITITEGAEGIDVDAQSQAFAQGMSPSNLANIGESARTIAAGTKSFLGGVSEDYVKSQIEAGVKAQAPTTMPDYEGRDIGGVGTVAYSDVTAEDMLAIQKAEGDIAQTTAQTDVLRMTAKEKETMLPLDAEARKAATSKIYSGIGLDEAQTSRITQLLPTELEINQGKVAEMAQAVKESDAKIEKWASENNVNEQRVELLKGQISKLAVDTDMASKLLSQSDEEFEAKLNQMQANAKLANQRAANLEEEGGFIAQRAEAEINQITANIGLTEARTDVQEATGVKMAEDLRLLEKFGEREREAALNLVEAKVLSTGRPQDLEEFQVGLLMQNQELEQQRDSMPSGPALDEIERRIKNNNERIANAAVQLADTTATADYFSKVNPVTTLNHMIKSNADALNLDMELSSTGEIISSFDESQQPTYFKAQENAISQFTQQFSGSTDAIRQSISGAMSLNSAIKDFSARTDADVVDIGEHGSISAAKAAAMNTPRTYANGNPKPFQNGDIATYKNANNRIIYLVYSNGEFVGASF